MVYLLFFLSGFAALVYEISWSRQIGLLFGHTVYAGATVLGAYFAGMALGNWLAARLTARGYPLATQQPLAGYGYAELIVALWAVLTPLALLLLRQPALAELLNHEVVGVQTAIRAAVAFLILLPATVPLGATLPLIAQHVSPPADPQPGRIALAYSLNTAGALVGVLAATYALILLLGVTASSYLAAAFSAACGLAALWLSCRGQIATARLAPPEPTLRIDGRLYALAALTGFGTLGLQVLYNRAFALILHNSTYSFGTIIVGFLLALALAAAVVSRSRVAPEKLIRIGLFGGAASIPLALTGLVLLTRMEYLEPRGGFLGYIAVTLGLVLLTVGPPVFMLGLVLPSLWRLAPGQPGRIVGRLTALNTIAATTGVLLTAFVLLPLAGTWGSFAVFTLLFLFAAWWYLRGEQRAPGWIGALASLAAIGAGVFVLSLPAQFEKLASRRGYEYVYRRETPYGQIDVVRHERTSVLTLRQDRFYRLGATGSDAAAFELRQGALPLLLHPQPNSVCYLGLATGITAGAALHDPAVQHVTSVELIPEVVEAAALFADYNAGILESPASRVVVNDARHFLYASGDRYDVIVSDLFVPWHSQTGYLYTAEHYASASRRLEPGGLFFQWLPAYQLSQRELTMIIESFASVFPHVTLWIDENLHRYPLIGLAGSAESLQFDFAKIDVRSEQIHSSLAESWPGEPMDLGSTVLQEHYAGLWQARPGAVLNTDEHPRVEFLAPVADRAGLDLTDDRWAAFKSEVLAELPQPALSSPGKSQP